MILERESDARRIGGVPKHRRRDFSPLIGLKGVPDALFAAQFKLYEEYVKSTNLLLNA